MWVSTEQSRLLAKSQHNNIQDPAAKIQRGQKALLKFELNIEYPLTLFEEAKHRKHNQRFL